MHSAHRVRHAVGSRACRHVVGVERTTRATARRDGEVFFAVVNAPFLVSACDGVLETSGVGGVACDGDVNVFKTHNRNAFGDVVCAVNSDCRALAV